MVKIGIGEHISCLLCDQQERKWRCDYIEGSVQDERDWSRESDEIDDAVLRYLLAGTLALCDSDPRSVLIVSDPKHQQGPRHGVLSAAQPDHQSHADSVEIQIRPYKPRALPMRECPGLFG
ncbi:hypothetical protein PMIN06_010828 [Paraphaeosphaeria minitans]